MKNFCFFGYFLYRKFLYTQYGEKPNIKFRVEKKSILTKGTYCGFMVEKVKEVIKIYSTFLSKLQKLESQISDLKKQIKQLPQGKLICARNGKYYKWYHSIGKKRTYISKKKRKLAQQLAWKKYLTQLLEDKIKERNALHFYLEHQFNPPKAEELLKISEYRELLADYLKPLNEELADWSNEEYEKNEKYPEHLIHCSSSGNMVRSKSESIIDTILFINCIPFRYECMLEIGDVKLFPDFTIRHPRTGKIYYWEHFGMMDNPEYAQNALNKLRLYVSCGIIPSQQLITTYETKEKPLSSREVEKIIAYYFQEE